MKITVRTVLSQELEVPEGASKEEILDFLAAYQSFRSAFQGLDSLDGQYRITDLFVIDETVEYEETTNG